MSALHQVGVALRTFLYFKVSYTVSVPVLAPDKVKAGSGMSFLKGSRTYETNNSHNELY